MTIIGFVAPEGLPQRLHIASAWRRLRSDPAHGPLPALLVGLTVLTGVVDAVSILSLGRVFVANMTGNVVFTGFALTGALGFSLAASLAALAGFLVGAGAGGRLVRRFGDDRAVLLTAGAAAELALIVAALIAVQAVGPLITPAVGAVVAAVMAIGMGVQNAVVRGLAVPDLTTTVLTMTLTGIAADIRAGKPSRAMIRRLLAVAAMLAGAVAGAGLVLHQGPAAALALAAGLLAIVAVGAGRAASRAAGRCRLKLLRGLLYRDFASGDRRRSTCPPTGSPPGGSDFCSGRGRVGGGGPGLAAASSDDHSRWQPHR